MKNLVKKLVKTLNEQEKTLEINGKDLMDVLGITDRDLSDLCDKHRCELYDNMVIETSTVYARKLKQLFDFTDEVYWYKKGEVDPKYITIGMSKVYTSCEEFIGNFLKVGNFKNYSISLKKVIDILKELSSDEEIKVQLKYFYYEYVELIIQNKELINVKYTDIENEHFEKEEETMLLYQLIVLSYDIPLVETLSILGLIE